MASTSRHLVVDGSNIATESRTLPSLAQLDEAVRAVQAEDPGRQITVIVDATFAHRIDASERTTFEDANNAGEIVMPPAGAVGRGDAFILQVAEKADAAVLSNDSFQEFHGEHPWLFEEGRLIGGKPVEGIGWVFVPRVPVRGPASRRATRDAKGSGKSSRPSRSGRAEKSTRTSRRAPEGPAPKPNPSNPPPKKRGESDNTAAAKSDRRRGDRRKSASEPNPSKAKRDATSKSAASNKSTNTSKTGAKKSNSRNVEELNSARDFMMFVTQHSIGDEVTAVVDRFSSHGCYLRASSAQCYLPSSSMGDPAPSRARDVVSLGQAVIVRVESLDSDRRGINVVLVRTEPVNADGSKKPVRRDGSRKRKKPSGSSRGSKAIPTSQHLASVADESAGEANPTRSTTTVATKTAKRARKRPAAKKVTKKKAAKATSSARASKAAAKRTAKKTTAKKTAKKAPAKKAAKKATKKATAKKTAKKAPAKKAAKKTTAKKAPAKKAAKKTTKKATAKKTAKKAPAKKAAKKTTKKATAKKTAKKVAKKR